MLQKWKSYLGNRQTWGREYFEGEEILDSYGGSSHDEQRTTACWTSICWSLCSTSWEIFAMNNSGFYLLAFLKHGCFPFIWFAQDNLALRQKWHLPIDALWLFAQGANADFPTRICWPKARLACRRPTVDASFGWSFFAASCIHQCRSVLLKLTWPCENWSCQSLKTPNVS